MNYADTICIFYLFEYYFFSCLLCCIYFFFLLLGIMCLCLLLKEKIPTEELVVVSGEKC